MRSPNKNVFKVPLSLYDDMCDMEMADIRWFDTTMLMVEDSDWVLTTAKSKSAPEFRYHYYWETDGADEFVLDDDELRLFTMLWNKGQDALDVAQEDWSSSHQLAYGLSYSNQGMRYFVLPDGNPDHSQIVNRVVVYYSENVVQPEMLELVELLTVME